MIIKYTNNRGKHEACKQGRASRYRTIKKVC